MEPEIFPKCRSILRGLPVWKNRRIQIRRLKGGMTNFNFLVADRGKKFVARFAPETNVLLGLNRKKETFNIRALAKQNIAPKIVKFYSRSNLLIVSYIPGRILSPAACRDRKTITDIAYVLRDLHFSGKKFKGRFNPFDTVRNYIGIVRRRNSWLPENIQKQIRGLEQVEKQVGRFSANFPCHLDLMMENLVRTPEGIKILDWEYSANSDFRFDLAMLSAKGGFTKEDDVVFLQAYGLYDPRSFKEVQLMKAAIYFREAAWGLLQFAVSKIKFDYKKYALENLASFQSIAGR